METFCTKFTHLILPTHAKSELGDTQTNSLRYLKTWLLSDPQPLYLHPNFKQSNGRRKNHLFDGGSK